MSTCEDFERICRHWSAYFEDALEEIERCDDIGEMQEHVDRSRRVLNVFMDDSIRSQRLTGQKIIELEALLGCKLPTDSDGNIDFDLIAQACLERAAELEPVGA